MGFCPYFLHDQGSEGGPSAPLLLFPAAVSTLTVTTVFSPTFL